MKKTFNFVLFASALFMLFSCGADDAIYDMGAGYPPPTAPDAPEDSEDPEPEISTQQWIQFSTDDSTSMASAQMFKAGFASRSLKAHEFINYYDPAPGLFEEEEFAITAEVAGGVEMGLKADLFTAPIPVQCAYDTQADSDSPAEQCDATVDAEILELLFQMRAPAIAQEVRRNWNVFLCVDVSGSMSGDNIEFVRSALDRMMRHFKEGDRLTLITFDSNSHDVFIDKEFSENQNSIRAAFADLSPGDSTNMLAGLERTYELAQSHFDSEMLQRVLVFSDGAANVGDTHIQRYADLTRMNGQEGIYLSGIGVGGYYDWDRMDQLTDAGKGAHVYLPSDDEVGVIFGDYFPKLLEVAADEIAIEMLLPTGLYLQDFSGEEIATDPQERLQNIVLAAGDDMTFLARLIVSDTAALDEPMTLKVSLRPLGTGEEILIEESLASVRELILDPGLLFERPRIVKAFADYASEAYGAPTRDELKER
ncbi:VWA domain-containing protein, partial [Myxococcota bacterium]|nr:VWA domain-containing protein [Myxococcota bacterium]